MNAIQFIKEHGVEKAREVVEGAPHWPVIGWDAVGGNYIFKQCEHAPCSYSNLDNAWSEEYAIEIILLDDLKRLVESIDLINKLGGIEVAKEKLTYGNSISAMRLSYETTITGRDGTKQNVITGVYLEDLEQAIADYESIRVSMFKVNQKIVYHTLPHKRLFYVKAVLEDSIVVRECWDEAGAKSFSEFPPYSDIRHATPEEIAAGHRIDHISQEGNMVHDLGDDSHIENHVSPLCKVGVK